MGLLYHWVSNGVQEGRQSSANSHGAFYLNKYLAEFQAAGITNPVLALKHWVQSGKQQGRCAVGPC